MKYLKPDDRQNLVLARSHTDSGVQSLMAEVLLPAKAEALKKLATMDVHKNPGPFAQLQGVVQFIDELVDTMEQARKARM